MPQTLAPRTQKPLILAIVAIAVVAGICIVWWSFNRVPVGKYGPVIDELAAGELTADSIGRVDLSKPFPGLTPHDEIFVTRRPDGSFLALFPTFYDKGPAIAGWMYTSRPLRDADTFSNTYAIGFDRRLIRVGQWGKLNIDKRADDHWYRVSYGVN